MTDIGLLPCPFCGGEAEIRHPEAGLAWPDWEVCCVSQLCDANLTGNSEEDAAKCWNLRAAITPLKGETLTESEKEVALAQAVEFADYVERPARGAMCDAAKRFLSLPYALGLASRITPIRPCPFCGGQTFLVQSGTHIECMTPECRGNWMGPSVPWAIPLKVDDCEEWADGTE